MNNLRNFFRERSLLDLIWVGFFVIGFLIALWKTLHGDTQIFGIIVNGIEDKEKGIKIDGLFQVAENAVMKIALPLAGVMTFFLGLLSIAEKAGAINFIARLIGPFLSRLFPEIPQNHPVMGQMVMNFSANMLGLDNAATPFGLKAMQSLQDLNTNKDEASNSQIMFMVLHSAGPVLIPLSIMAMRSSNGAADPTDVFVPCLIATYMATLTGLLLVAFKQKIKFDSVVITWLAALTAMIGLLVAWFYFLKNNYGQASVQQSLSVFSNGLLLVIIVGFVLSIFRKKVDIFPTFIEGAKAGFETTIKIIPYLVGMLVAISIFRNSGAMSYVIDALKWLFALTGFNTDFMDAMPTALMHPLSGGASRALMIDTMKTFGADSFAGRLACVFQGSADTIFYVVALYFGSVGIKRTRYTLAMGLIADLVGIVVGILMSYLLFY